MKWKLENEKLTEVEYFTFETKNAQLTGTTD